MRVIKTIIEQTIKSLFRIIGLLPTQKIIYFESFHGKQYSDNPKAIYLELLSRQPDYKLVWGVTKGHEELFEKNQLTYVRRFSWQWFLTMPRAAAWVMNTRTPLFLHKPTHTIYVQTWHGTPLKKIGVDIPSVNIPGYDTSSYRQEFAAESARWDVLLSQNKYSTDIFRHAFAYQGEILEVGYPRNDRLVQADKQDKEKARIKRELGITSNKKVILYAPTWRENQSLSQGTYEFTSPIDFTKLVEQVSNDVMILVRMHYLVSQQFDFSAFGDQVIDVSTYPDMSELLLVSELLITDYSSSFFDFALLDKPMIFYLYDRESYEDELRGLYLLPEEVMPGDIVLTQAEMTSKINEILVTGTSENRTQLVKFKETYCQSETGQAAKVVADYLLKDR